MKTHKKCILFAMLLIFSSLSASTASAAWLIALIDGTSIALIDPSIWKVTQVAPIKGVDKLIGFDVRPSDKMLYGVTTSGLVVTIDPTSGKTWKKSKLSAWLDEGVVATVDFNPMADRLRLMGSDGTSLRVNVDDGKAITDGSHNWKSGDPSASKTPMIVAGAYTNSANSIKPESTTLYNIEAGTSTLVIQAPPNDGVLSTVGFLGMPVSGPVAFNITASMNGNTGWLMASGLVHKVNLKTGKAAVVGKPAGLLGTVIDIAWWE